MVEIAGRTDIPVAVGAKVPTGAPPGDGSLRARRKRIRRRSFPEPKTKPISQPAAEFIRDIVRKYPGEVTLIPIGPLTNIATALNLDPELAGMVRGIVLMGGSLSGGNITPAAEFNIYVDPEAARIVFQSGIPITMVGLDATRNGLCSRGTQPVTSVRAGGFDADIAFLQQHTQVLVLGDPSGSAQVAVAPAYQGRVMTSTTGGGDAPSFGWIGRAAIASGKRQPHMNVFGGEDRFWLGPEGGQFALYFRPRRSVRPRSLAGAGAD